MSNESGGLERDPSVSELQATVDALRQDLVDATERIRELEAATDGVTPSAAPGGTSDTDADAGTETGSITETGSMDPGALDALADGAVDAGDDVTVGDLDADGVGDTPGMPGRDPTKDPQNTQDAELVDAGSSSADGSGSEGTARGTSTAANGGDDRSATDRQSRTEDPTPESTGSETTTAEGEEDDDSDDIIVA